MLLHKYLLAVFPLIVLLLTAISLSQTEVTVNATVSPYISVVFNYTSVSFGSLVAGTTNNYKYGGMVTIDTNGNYRVEVYGSDFSDGAGHTISISNLKLDTAASPTSLSSSNAVSVQTSYVAVDTYSYTVATNHHGYWLTIPSGTYAASYSTVVYIRYVNV